MNGERMEHYRKILEEVTKHASETERRADEAERETVKLKKVEYMSDRIGNVYTGVISSVTKWGMYVELPNTIEGSDSCCQYALMTIIITDESC